MYNKYFSESSTAVPTNIWLGTCEPSKHQFPYNIWQCPQHHCVSQWAASDPRTSCWFRPRRQQTLRMGLWPEL